MWRRQPSSSASPCGTRARRHLLERPPLLAVPVSKRASVEPAVIASDNARFGFFLTARASRPSERNHVSPLHRCTPSETDLGLVACCHDRSAPTPPSPPHLPLFALGSSRRSRVRLRLPQTAPSFRQRAASPCVVAVSRPTSPASRFTARCSARLPAASTRRPIFAKSPAPSPPIRRG